MKPAHELEIQDLNAGDIVYGLRSVFLITFVDFHRDWVGYKRLGVKDEGT